MVTVNYEVTTRTSEDSIRESELLPMPASGAILRSIGGVHCHELPTSTFSLVGKTGNELAPTSIGNRLSQAVIMQHTVGIDVFHADDPELIHNPMRELVGKVRPSIGDTLMDIGHNLFSPSSLWYSLIEQRQLPLSLSQSPLVCPEETGIGDSFPSGERSKGFQSHIDTDCPIRLAQRLIGNLAAKAHKPFASSTPAYIAGLDITDDRSVQDSLNVPDLRKHDVLIVQGESSLRVSEAVIPPSTSKAGIAGLFACLNPPEESFERQVNTDCHVLQDLAVDQAKGRALLFQDWNRHCLGMIVQGFLPRFPGVLALFQKIVVEPAALIQSCLQKMLLFGAWIDSVLECFKHHLYYSLIGALFQEEEAGFHLSPEGGSLPAPHFIK